MSVELIRVDPRFPGTWEKLSGYLELALAEGGEKDWSLQDVFQAASAGAVQLWGLIDAGNVFGAAVTVESTYPQRKVLEVLLTGTEPHTEDKWLECLAQIKAIAKAFGASTLVGTGRPGWARKLGADRERRVWEIDL
jgi:hypothetical protein